MRDYENEVKDIYDDAAVINISSIIDDIWRCLSRYWLSMLLVILSSAALVLSVAGFIYYPEYKAAVTYMVNKTQDSSQNILMAKYLGTAFEETLTASGCGQDIANALGVDSLDSIPAEITGYYVEGINMITIEAVSDHYSVSQSVAETIKEVYPSYASDVVGNVDLKEVKNPMNEKEPMTPYHAVYYGLIGGVLGVFACVLFVVFYTASQKTVRSTEDIRRITNIPCLTQLPTILMKARSRRRNEMIFGKSRVGNEFQDLLNVVGFKLEHKKRGEESKVFLVTSSGRNEGTTTIATGLARALASIGRKVVLMDMNLHQKSNPDNYLVMQVNQAGIANYLAGDIEVKDILKEVDKNFFMIPSGTAREAIDKLLTKGDIPKLLQYLKEEESFEYIIIDSPPVTLMNDGVIIGGYVDETIYVMKQGQSKMRSVEEGIDTLQSSGINILGYILNFAESGITGNGKYGKYSKYGYSKYDEYVDFENERY